jgi:hypothetical protein
VACGHDPQLVARSYPRKVTLTWVSPDTRCNAEVIRFAVVSVRLSAPLGNRALVQASGGGLVCIIDQRNLPRRGPIRPAALWIVPGCPGAASPTSSVLFRSTGAV